MCCTMEHKCQCQTPVIDGPLIQCGECNGYTTKDNKEHYLRHERERSIEDFLICNECHIAMSPDAITNDLCILCKKGDN